MIQMSLWAQAARTCSLASGSSGNALYFASGRTKILIDCGISAKRIREALFSVGVAEDELSGILITHEHTDHTRGLDVLARRLRIPIYMTPGSYGAWYPWQKPEAVYDYRPIYAGHSFLIGDVEVTAFSTPHDAAESVGYRLTDGQKTVSVMTDLGEASADLLHEVRASDLVYIEANYDDHMLWAGSYPWPLKQRIASDHGHLSNDAAAVAIYQLMQSGTSHFVLSHLSQENNMPALADLTVQQALRSRGADPAADLALRLAPRHVPGPMVTL